MISRTCSTSASARLWGLAYAVCLAVGCSASDRNSTDEPQDTDSTCSAGVCPSGGSSPAAGGAQGSGGASSSGGSSASGGSEASGGNAAGGAAASGGATAGGGSGGNGADSGTGGAAAGVFRVFLLIGQSNMAGGAETEPADLIEDDRVKVLGYDDCAATGRKYNEWDTASPPLHACWANGIGPGDHFAKTVIQGLPEQDTIGLVPCAIPGVDVDFFRKGVISTRRDEFTIPPDDHWDGAYDWVIERAQLAQMDGGVIAGILFHQGESDIQHPEWNNKVKGIVDDLRADLGIGNVPFLAGELLYGGAGDAHNSLVNQLPSQIENAHVVSAQGLVGTDSFHFDSAGVRTLGTRYGQTWLETR